jgi:hypothetical protein
MIKIITKEDHSVLFKKEEIILSNVLNNIFFDDDCIKQEIKIDKISINELAKIKALLSLIVINDITIEKLQSKSLVYYELISHIKITPLFNCCNFFALLDIVNFLNIEILLYLMKDYIKEIINDLTFTEVIENFCLEKSNFSELENNRINVINHLS